MNIVVIGTNHLYQFGGAVRSDSQNQAFACLLRHTFKTHGVRCFAEEMSCDVLQARGCSQSTVARAAVELGVTHAYCDPSNQEQYSLGLCVERNAQVLKHVDGWADEEIEERIALEHRQRERFWLERVREVATWPCLFVCGSEHARPFCSLLQESGFDVQLIAQNWDA